jgi:hypothetical protein
MIPAVHCVAGRNSPLIAIQPAAFPNPVSLMKASTRGIGISSSRNKTNKIGRRTVLLAKDVNELIHVVLYTNVHARHQLDELAPHPVHLPIGRWAGAQMRKKKFPIKIRTGLQSFHLRVEDEESNIV